MKINDVNAHCNLALFVVLACIGGLSLYAGFPGTFSDMFAGKSRVSQTAPSKTTGAPSLGLSPAGFTPEGRAALVAKSDTK